MESIKSILESLLFISEEPLTLERLKTVLAPVSATEIRNALNELFDEYESRRGGFVLKEVAGGFQFRTRPEHTEWITKLIQPKPPRLSKAALETLAIIAYKQPLIRSDIEHIRGVDCGGVLKVLLERNLIRVLGRKEIPGRPLIYATTKRFLEVFDLKDLKDLPTPKEIDDMGQALVDRSDVVIEEDDERESVDESGPAEYGIDPQPMNRMDASESSAQGQDPREHPAATEFEDDEAEETSGDDGIHRTP